MHVRQRLKAGTDIDLQGGTAMFLGLSPTLCLPIYVDQNWRIVVLLNLRVKYLFPCCDSILPNQHSIVSNSLMFALRFNF
jgi:hypothetical protein